MKKCTYQTITGRNLDLSSLTENERVFLVGIDTRYRKAPEWSAFSSWWTTELRRANLPVESMTYRICQDLEARLGLAQGKVAPPDYRDYLADLIEERCGSRYRFCKESGIDPGHLSRVFASRSELSLQSLKLILDALHATLVIRPEEAFVERETKDLASMVSCPQDVTYEDKTAGALTSSFVEERFATRTTAPASEAAVQEVPTLISELYRIVDRLEELFPGRPFTVDGHLLGSIGEVLAAYRYNLDLRRPSTLGCDAESVQVGKIEIKTTQRGSVSFRCEPPHLVVFRLPRDGQPEEVYNGPGRTVWPHVGRRNKNGQYSISLAKLRALGKQVPREDRLEIARSFPTSS
jgi:hypothetical protein